MPPIIMREGVSRKMKNEARPIHKGLVVTSAVLDATEVYSSELIQVAKCSARKKPAASAIATCRRVSRASSWRDCSSATGVMMSAAKPSRQLATASELTPSAWAIRAKMAPKEMAARPMARMTKGNQRADVTELRADGGKGREEGMLRRARLPGRRRVLPGWRAVPPPCQQG